MFPGLAIVLTVLGLTLVGESINDLNDPRLRGRKTRRRQGSGPDPTAVRPGGPASRSEKLMTINIGSVSDRHAASGSPSWTSTTSRSLSPPTAGTSTPSRTSASRSTPARSLAIVGESGSGKTVTAKTILGLLPETAISSGRGADQRQQRHQRQRGEAPADPRPRRGHGLPGTVHGPEPRLHRGLADRRGHPCPRRRGGASGSPPRKPRPGPSRPCARWASRIRKPGSTTIRTSSPAGRSSASSLPRRWP